MTSVWFAVDNVNHGDQQKCGLIAGISLMCFYVKGLLRDVFCV